jgi:hypothetical protein
MANIPVSTLSNGVLKEALRQCGSATVSVRGQPRFVVIEMDRYKYLRECELAAALAESRAAMAAGQFVRESPDDHMARLACLP